MAVGVVTDSPVDVVNGDTHCEVVHGQRRELPPLGAFENSLAKILLVALDTHGINNGLGEAYSEMLFLLDAAADLQRRPDVAFVSYMRWPRGQQVPRTAAWNVVPDLAVEVVSRSHTWDEILEKIRDYFRSGVRRVWIVSPIVEQVYVYTALDKNDILNRDDALSGEDVAPGFTFSLAELFGGKAT
ncbi:MAG: Uma2 family endonuclease [Gemmataceae bacterium]|nr:Uma2 family endonuclease [Gemmataceae bacterium]